MHKIALIYVFSLFLTIGAFAQTAAKQTAPVAWQKYQIPEQKISVLLPKMPVVERRVDVCGETERTILRAYAEDAVYQVKIEFKRADAAHARCEEKRFFTAENLAVRLAEIKNETGAVDEIKLAPNKREATKIKGKIFDYYIFDDTENGKWIELAVARRADAKANDERFVKSLEFVAQPTGIVVGNGAEQILGDETAENAGKISAKPLNAAAKTEALMIVTVPMASYTDEARQNQVKGTIMLKVKFLANGAVGEVVPLNELPHGLTEAAISAARKIFFLPQKTDGINAAVTKQLQYSFSIY